MKIYTIISNSHRFLFDQFFKKSLEKYEPSAELIVIEQEQICSSANYYDVGWKEAMGQKIDAYLNACNTNDGFFIWSDVDIEFYDKFIDQCVLELGKDDIAFQEGVGGEYCAGFFICRISQKTKDFFTFLKNNYDRYSCDQEAINSNIHLIKAKFLSHKFLNISFQHRQWSGQNIDIPESTIMFHANYTVGLQHKIMLLAQVKEKLEYIKKHNINKNNAKHNPNIKITNAFYGLFSDVTEAIMTINNEFVIGIDTLRGDPTPGATKYLYCFDKNYKLVHKPIKEGLAIRIT